VLALRDRNPDNPGRIKLFLSRKPNLELKEWITTDSQGLDTRVELTEVNKTEALDPALFRAKSLVFRSSTSRHPRPPWCLFGLKQSQIWGKLKQSVTIS